MYIYIYLYIYIHTIFWATSPTISTPEAPGSRSLHQDPHFTQIGSLWYWAEAEKIYQLYQLGSHVKEGITLASRAPHPHHVG